MNPEIPTQRQSKCITRDIGLACACLADDRIPRLAISDIQAVEENGSRRYSFVFPNSKDVLRVFAAWKKAQRDIPSAEHAWYVYRAFEYWKRFCNVIEHGVDRRRPQVLPPEFIWTVNTKIPAAGLALIPGELIDESRLSRMVYRHGNECGYVVRRDETTYAFADPNGYVAAHGNTPLAYVVAAFTHRDHLRDLVKRLPARHRFEHENDIYLVPEPNQPIGIPTHVSTRNSRS